MNTVHSAGPGVWMAIMLVAIVFYAVFMFRPYEEAYKKGYFEERERHDNIATVILVFFGAVAMIVILILGI